MTTTSAPTQHQSTPPGRWFVAMGFVVATIVTTSLTCASGIYTSAYQSTRSERTAQVQEFIAEANKLDPLVKAFVADIKDGQLTEKSRSAIRNNLLAQSGELRKIRGVAPKAARPAIDRYSSTLAQADEALKTASTPLDSRNFVQSTIHLVEERDSLFQKLQKPPSLLFVFE